MLMRSWRNWQTRKTKDLVGNSMQVQFLSTAPNKRAPFTGAFLFWYDTDISTGIEGGSHFARAKCFALRDLDNDKPVGKGRR